MSILQIDDVPLFQLRVASAALLFAIRDGLGSITEAVVAHAKLIEYDSFLTAKDELGEAPQKLLVLDADDGGDQLPASATRPAA